MLHYYTDEGEYVVRGTMQSVENILGPYPFVKCHDLKHQLRAIRNSDHEDKEKYLEEIEDSIGIYEAIVKTGNEVLDTILKEGIRGAVSKSRPLRLVF